MTVLPSHCFCLADQRCRSRCYDVKEKKKNPANKRRAAARKEACCHVAQQHGMASKKMKSKKNGTPRQTRVSAARHGAAHICQHTRGISRQRAQQTLSAAANTRGKQRNGMRAQAREKAHNVRGDAYCSVAHASSSTRAATRASKA